MRSSSGWPKRCVSTYGASMRLMRRLLAFTLIACSSPPQPPTVTPLPTDATACAPQDQNGYGDCYPTHLLGDAVGDHMGDATFTTTSNTIRLGDFYDPQQHGIPGILGGVGIKLIHLTVGAMWSTPTTVEADLITGSNVAGQNPDKVAWATEFAPDGVVFIIAFDGYVDGVGATLTDLQGWVATRNASQAIPVLSDPSLGLGELVDVNIDARSMQILDEATGGDVTIDQTVENDLVWVTNNPPRD
jgi:hypothetical protein